MNSKIKLKNLKNFIKSNEIEFIDLKCTDLIGKLHHITLPISESVLDESVYNGVGFDASSYKFSKVENSDMVLIPDLSTAIIDPFR